MCSCGEQELTVYSAVLHDRYIPSASLQYVYPDEYAAVDIDPVGDDSNILMAREPSSSEQPAVKHKQILVDVG